MSRPASTAGHRPALRCLSLANTETSVLVRPTVTPAALPAHGLAGLRRSSLSPMLATSEYETRIEGA